MTGMDEALAYLREQSITRGLGGRLEDFDIRLYEDQRTVSVWAYYELDPPLMACFELRAAIDPAEFDAAAFYKEAERYAATPSWLN
jgi:hypothetical protein